MDDPNQGSMFSARVTQTATLPAQPTITPADDLWPPSQSAPIGEMRSPDGRIGMSDYVYLRARVVGLTADGLCMVQGIPGGKSGGTDQSGRVYYVDQSHLSTIEQLRAMAAKA